MTLSKMFNQDKQDRLELLLEIAEIIELLVRIGMKYNNSQALDLAEKFGEDYLKLQNENHTHLHYNQTLGLVRTESCAHQE